jgi:hypothetical protein
VSSNVAWIQGEQIGQIFALGQMFSLGGFLKISEVAQIYGLLFPKLSVLYLF